MIITLPKPINLKPQQRLYIFPFGEIQSESELDRVRDLVSWAGDQKKEGHKVLGFGTGDYIETTSPSERIKLAGANLHDSTYETLNKATILQVDEIAHILKPLDVMSLLTGHHKADLRFQKKVGGQVVGRVVSSDEYLAEKLGAEYAGDGLQLIDMLVNGLPFRIVATHGYGSARTNGARVTKRTRMAEVVINAHWYVMGHDNDKVSYPREPLEVRSRGELGYLKQYFTGIGSFQKAYDVGNLVASYAEKLALPPTALGTVIATIRYDEKKRRLDYHVSN